LKTKAFIEKCVTMHLENVRSTFPSTCVPKTTAADCRWLASHSSPALNSPRSVGEMLGEPSGNCRTHDFSRIRNRSIGEKITLLTDIPYAPLSLRSRICSTSRNIRIKQNQGVERSLSLLNVLDHQSAARHILGAFDTKPVIERVLCLCWVFSAVDHSIFSLRSRQEQGSWAFSSASAERSRQPPSWVEPRPNSQISLSYASREHKFRALGDASKLDRPIDPLSILVPDTWRRSATRNRGNIRHSDQTHVDWYTPLELRH